MREVKARLRREGLDHIPVVVGGIVSAEDDNVLRNIGVAAVYTPRRTTRLTPSWPTWCGWWSGRWSSAGRRVRLRLRKSARPAARPQC